MAFSASAVNVLPEVLEAFPDEHVLRVRGRIAPQFTKLEVELLTQMAMRPGRVVPREILFELAWRQPLAEGSRSVDVYVRRLRQKLAEILPEWTFIHTHVGVGYRLDPQPTPSTAIGTRPNSRQAMQLADEPQSSPSTRSTEEIS